MSSGRPISDYRNFSEGLDDRFNQPFLGSSRATAPTTTTLSGVGGVADSEIGGSATRGNAYRGLPDLKRPGMTTSRVQFNDDPSYYSAPSRPSTTTIGSHSNSTGTPEVLFNRYQKIQEEPEIMGGRAKRFEAFEEPTTFRERPTMSPDMTNINIDTDRPRSLGTNKTRTLSEGPTRNRPFMTPAQRIQSRKNQTDKQRMYRNLGMESGSGSGSRYGPDPFNSFGSRGFPKSTSLGNLGTFGQEDHDLKYQRDKRMFTSTIDLNSDGLNTPTDVFDPLGKNGLYASRSRSRLGALHDPVIDSQNTRHGDGYLHSRVPATKMKYSDIVPQSIVELSQSSYQVRNLLSLLDSVNDKFERQENDLAEMKMAARQIGHDTLELNTRLEEFKVTLDRQQRALDIAKNRG